MLVDAVHAARLAFFGGIPAVQKHFELVIIAILVLSLIPTIVGLLKAKFGKKKPTAEDTYRRNRRRRSQ